MEDIKDIDLVGVEVRNTNFIKINGLTWEEVQDTFEIMRKLFDRRGYLYLREANNIFKEKIKALENEDLIAENLALKKELEVKKGTAVPKTMGK
jgi:hypothetical protein